MATRSSTRARGGFASYWLPVVLYAAVIFAVSAQPRLKPPFAFQNSDKFWHLVEYAGLGLLLARGLRGTSPTARPLVRALIALSVGITLGTADELFQSTVPGRDCSALDLIADTLGVGIAQIVHGLATRS